ncbi:MAG: SH3 domain-containing protein [Anaeromyxobacteraceae bacterium]
MRAALPVLAVLAAALACSKPSPPAPTPGASGAAAPGGAPVASGGAAAPSPGGPATYVSTVTLLRREPSDARKVPGPNGKEVANYLATLQRGEQVTIAGEPRRAGDDAWVKVRTSDDSEGWLKRSALLEGDGIVEATVIAQADVFDRPDLLAANAARKLEPATLLLVVRQRTPFSEVNVGSGANAWVLTDRLATGPTEVGIAKLAEKGRWLRRSGKQEEAAQILALARTQFPGAPLLDQVALQLGEAPAAAPVPAGGEVPGAPQGTTGTPQ